MNPYYSNILVPVDNVLNTRKAVAKALDLARPYQSTIHLTQLIPTWNPFGKLRPATAYKAGSKNALDSYIKTLLHLMEWKSLIEKYNHIARVKIHIMRGPSLNLLIKEVARRTSIDLIIITCDKTRRWLPGIHPASSDRLARVTDCAVLSLHAERKRGIPEEIEMLSKALPTHYNKKVSNDTGGYGVTSFYSMLSGN